jgi:hypothetical protein
MSKTLKPITSSKSFLRRPNASLKLHRTQSSKTVPYSIKQQKCENTIDVYCRFRPKKEHNSRLLQIHHSIFDHERLQSQDYDKLKNCGFEASKQLEISRMNSVRTFPFYRLKIFFD